VGNEMADKSTTFRSDDAFIDKIDKYVKDCFSGKSRSDFIRTAIEFYLDRKEGEFRSIPEEVINTIAFLLQLVVTIEDLNVERKIVKDEVSRLWQMVQNTQS